MSQQQLKQIETISRQLGYYIYLFKERLLSLSKAAYNLVDNEGKTGHRSLIMIAFNSIESGLELTKKRVVDKKFKNPKSPTIYFENDSPLISLGMITSAVDDVKKQLQNSTTVIPEERFYIESEIRVYNELIDLLNYYNPEEDVVIWLRIKFDDNKLVRKPIYVNDIMNITEEKISQSNKIDLKHPSNIYNNSEHIEKLAKIFDMPVNTFMLASKNINPAILENIIEAKDPYNWIELVLENLKQNKRCSAITCQKECAEFRCSTCGVAKYCDDICFEADRPRHEEMCKDALYQKDFLGTALKVREHYKSIDLKDKQTI
jgi:hypothetical protein